MRKRTIVLIAILTALLAACTGKTDYNTLLVQADSLMASRPDSALHMLEGISTESLSTKADRAYHALLLTQARDKNYIRQTDDSLIQVAVRYYDSMRDCKMQARAYYYWGSVYRDRNEQAIATEKFLIAIPFAQKAGDKVLLGRIYNNAGYLYYLQELYNKADSIFRQAERIGVQLNDTTLQAEALSMQGRIKLGQDDYPQAEKKLLQAQAVLGNFNQNGIQANIVRTLSLLYSRTQNKAKALQYAKQNISLQKDTTHCYYAFFTLGEAYFQAGQYDSATYYINKSLASSDYGIKTNAYMRLADITRIQGKTAASLEMERLYSACRDSLEQSSQHTKILETEQRINAQLQHAQYEDSLNKYILGITLSAIICTAIIGSFLLYRHFKHRKQEQKQLERENELRKEYVRQKEQLEQQEKEITALQDRIIRQHISEEQKHTLETELVVLNEQHTALVKKVRKYSDVTQKIDNILEIYKKGKVPKEFLDENDWARLLAETDPKGGINRISEMYGLSEIEFHLCILLLLDYSVTDMGRIIQRKRMSVYRIERSISKKMGRNYQAGELQKQLKGMLDDNIDR